jgi:hypothetical protein
MQKLVVGWRLSEQDIRSIVSGHSILAKAVSDSGVDEIEFFDRDVEAAARRSVPVGGHHIGTTRMDPDPKKGVVDDKCRLHEAETFLSRAVLSSQHAEMQIRHERLLLSL